MELLQDSGLDSSAYAGESPIYNESTQSFDERFDASQYAFFGRDVSEEFELGGMDDDDDPERGEARVGAEHPSGKELKQSQRSASEGELFGYKVTDKPTLDENETSGLASSFIKLMRQSPHSSDRDADFLETPAMSSDCITEEATSLSRTSGLRDHTIEVKKGARKWWPSLQQQLMSEVAREGQVGLASHQAYQRKQQWRGSYLGFFQGPSASNTNFNSQAVQHVLQTSAHTQAVQASLGDALPGGYIEPHPSHPVIGLVSSAASHFVSVPRQCGSISPARTRQASAAEWSSKINGQIAPSHTANLRFLPFTALTPPQVVLQHQHSSVSQFHAAHPLRHPDNLNQHCMSHTLLVSSQRLPNVDYAVSTGVLDHRFQTGAIQCQRYNQLTGMTEGHFLDRGGYINNRQPLRSKYMTVEEIETIVKIQWAATHSNDPYFDDYYHQAVQAKLSTLSSLVDSHFAPSHLRDFPSNTRSSVEPHAYLRVDALGRVPFSSIHRPRPLLEMETSAGSHSFLVASHEEDLADGVPQLKPLEQEPMLTARIAIEDGMCLLLDVDDVDRTLLRVQYPEGGTHLKWRRQLLLERLAALLRLLDANDVDDNGSSRAEPSKARARKGSLMFRHILSLTKGQKLLLRYLHLLTPGNELVHIVGMAIFRHLRFLFGGIHTDPHFTAITVQLANAAAESVLSMDLPALSSYLLAVVSASEQPPLRPMGSPAGDGASLVLRGVLMRATRLLTDPKIAYSVQSRTSWQASFDAFFNLLAEYCTKKYDSICHSLMMTSTSDNSMAITTAAAIEMSKEMPLELMRASLPHTSDQQRIWLQDFAQRSMPTSLFPSQTGSTL